MKRSCGVLLHISSLPGKYGIGAFGREAYRFADFLHQAGAGYWQVLPLGPTGYGDSPYQSFSAFALNPYFIDLEALQKQGLLTAEECDSVDFGSDPELVDFHLLFQGRLPLLKLAFQRRSALTEDDLLEETAFYSEQGPLWLDDYAFYMALKYHFDMDQWDLWDEGIRTRQEDAMIRFRDLLADEIALWKFTQYLAFSQWQALKSYCHSLGVQIIGDIPIYTATDSADTWSLAKSGIFAYDSELRVQQVAGCPPDFFSADGQFWGNPVYNWPENKNQGYRWWLSRIRHSLKLYDYLRIDHFRGLSAYWSIPAASNTAADGVWMPGPADDFIHAVEASCGGRANIIAEDLGVMTEDVRRLLKESGFPGMKVMSFAFETDMKNEHLPINYKENSVVYIGTHDNDTITGWLKTAPKDQLEFAAKYLRQDGDVKKLNHWDFIEDILKSRADTVVLQMQDILGLPGSARMNTPSTLGGTNWCWRLKDGSLPKELPEKLKTLLKASGRL